MEEDNQDACGTEILDGKEIDMEERPAESAPIGELVAHVDNNVTRVQSLPMWERGLKLRWHRECA